MSSVSLRLVPEVLLHRLHRALESIRVALETPDLIGQAKGITIASMRCTSDEAYLMLKKQSQAEDLKLNGIAAGSWPQPSGADQRHR